MNSVREREERCHRPEVPCKSMHESWAPDLHWLKEGKGRWMPRWRAAAGFFLGLYCCKCLSFALCAQSRRQRCGHRRFNVAENGSASYSPSAPLSPSLRSGPIRRGRVRPSGTMGEGRTGQAVQEGAFINFVTRSRGNSAIKDIIWNGSRTNVVN